MAVLWASPVAQLVKNPAGDLGSIPELGRSSGEGKDYPLVFWPAVYTHIHNTCIYTYVCYHYYDSYGHM